MIARQNATEAAEASVTYPGTPENATVARRFVRAMLAHSPRVRDLELIASELITNAICHTPSGQQRGMFTITIQHRPGRARLEVADLGTLPWRPARPNRDEMTEHGRGLQIVTALADEVGYDVGPGDSQIIWADVSW
jgi:anti-sigma regulatory factor (Ser/Thr protein kinase)